MVIFAEVTENEHIIHRHLRGIHPLLDYDASESQSCHQGLTLKPYSADRPISIKSTFRRVIIEKWMYTAQVPMNNVLVLGNLCEYRHK